MTLGRASSAAVQRVLGCHYGQHNRSLSHLLRHDGSVCFGTSETRRTHRAASLRCATIADDLQLTGYVPVHTTVGDKPVVCTIA